MKHPVEEHFLPSDITRNKAILTLFKQGMVALDKKVSINNELWTRRDHARIMLKSMISLNLHLSKILEGINAFEIHGIESDVNFIDPQIIAVLVRRQYESTLLFKLMNNQFSEEQSDLIFKLWHHSGLKNRQANRPANDNFHRKESKVKAENELKIMNDLGKEILSTPGYLELDELGQKTINGLVRSKKFLIWFAGGSVRETNWKELVQRFDIKINSFTQLYPLFSMYAHPTYISTWHMFDALKYRSNEENVIRFLHFSHLFSGLFLHDFMQVFPESKDDVEMKLFGPDSTLSMFMLLGSLKSE